jgi:hypothetical protein
MVRGSHPDSATSSFTVLLQDAPTLDGKFTVFGKVLRGMDILDRKVKGVRHNKTLPIHSSHYYEGIPETSFFLVSLTACALSCCGFLGDGRMRSAGLRSRVAADTVEHMTCSDDNVDFYLSNKWVRRLLLTHLTVTAILLPSAAA